MLYPIIRSIKFLMVANGLSYCSSILKCWCVGRVGIRWYLKEDTVESAGGGRNVSTFRYKVGG